MKATRWFEKNEAERTGGSGTQGRKKKQKTKARDEGEKPRETHRILESIEKENKNPRYYQLLSPHQYQLLTWRGTCY